MKIKFATVAFLLFALSVQSQDLNDDIQKSKNEIALEISDLVTGSFQLKYERLVGEHFSVGLGLAYKGEDGIIKLSGLDTKKIKTGDITYSGSKIIPEVRYYLKKTTRYIMDGFILEPILKSPILNPILMAPISMMPMNHLKLILMPISMWYLSGYC